MSWNPNSYLKFQSARLRPALDLLSRAVRMAGDPLSVRSVLDLGCGPGNITPFLAQAFPNAVIEGVDMSEKMIAQAKDSLFSASISNSNSNKNKNDVMNAKSLRDRVHFRVNRIEDEVAQNKAQYDVVYANASLHWCLSHESLLPQVVRTHLVANGGVLAVQMPDTRTQPSHTLMETAALRTGLLDALKDVRIPRTERDPQWYFELLAPLTREVDLWSTEYVEQLSLPVRMGEGESDGVTALPSHTRQRHLVHEFTRATGLLPVIQALGGEEHPQCRAYLEEYDRLLSEAYPQTVVRNKYHHAHGKVVTLFPFKRFFFVAKT